MILNIRRGDINKLIITNNVKIVIRWRLILFWKGNLMSYHLSIIVCSKYLQLVD